MRYKVTFLLVAFLFAKEAIANEPNLEPSQALGESWTYDDYQVVKTNTRTLWFVDYYDIAHLKNHQGDSALLLTFTPEKLTREKVRTATVEALEDSNSDINVNSPSIQNLVDSLSLSLAKGDVIAIVYKDQEMQVQHNNKVVYQAHSFSEESIAFKNIWLGETPVDDLL
ncbi:chalcone isomerase family protein [Vibrio cyclitrophicus]|nr:chalcone isomerase family protein [Vibrio cyclitrophicus]UPR46683.1 chalcone isomerase family protein [Vibrio cyclitrophicus]UPR53028.1 chalcone isomerase family protein [Vibrio cyclitrophicus]